MSESIPPDRVYDLYSQSMKNDPYPVFDRMRHDDPVFSQPDIVGIFRRVPTYFGFSQRGQLNGRAFG